MFATNDFQLYNKAKSISSFGKEGGHYDYDIVRLGANFRMTEFQAVLGIEQLKRIEEVRKKRIENFSHYAQLLERWNNYIEVNISRSNPYCYIFVAEKKQDIKYLRTKLEEEGIGYSIYYPNPIPRLTYYRTKYGYKNVWFKNAAAISDLTVALPVGMHIEKEDIEKIVSIIKRG